MGEKKTLNVRCPVEVVAWLDSRAEEIKKLLPSCDRSAVVNAILEAAMTAAAPPNPERVVLWALPFDPGSRLPRRADPVARFSCLACATTAGRIMLDAARDPLLQAVAWDPHTNTGNRIQWDAPSASVEPLTAVEAIRLGVSVSMLSSQPAVAAG